MKFKTFIITKNKLAVLFLCAAAAAVLVALWRLMPAREEQTFCESPVYEAILSEALPDGSEHKVDIGGMLKRILGFDFTKPETIIGSYSSVFGQNGALPDKMPEEEALEKDEPPMPNREQIYNSVGLKMNNATGYKINIDDFCGRDMGFSADNDGAQVLVMHTHTTECYDGDQMQGETERNTDAERNVVAVGDEICKTLEANGIKTIHDTTYHDYPSYQGSYTRALSTVETQLKNNPSVKIVLDIHRDAFIYPDGSKLTVECEQNGIAAAQVMLVVGTNSMGLWHDNWEDNLAFAAKIQNAAEIMYPGLMRPVNLRTERFNEHLTHGSLILEVGANGNTLDEAKEGGKYVARAIAAVLSAK